MPAGAALVGLFCCSAATVLLILVSISSPTWDKISFLNVGSGNNNTLHYGAFGFTGSKVQVGYHFSIDSANSTILHNLTKTLILHSIAAGLSSLALLFGLCGATYNHAGTVLMSIFAGFAALVTFDVWVLDMVLFGIVRKRYRDAGQMAQYGNANWLTLGAFVVLLLGTCTAACGAFISRRKPKEAS